ncbi:MAG: MBL fold metallo-hydrolase [Cyclobacteriaceae bacterium]|nr:MBL fold metallo-hydrolase [Cyclobacteriaceae bacterium]
MITIKTFVFNPFMENTYILYDETKEAVIIDPGCYESYEKEELKSFIVEEDLVVKKLLNTHCHIDHVFGNHFIKEEYNVLLSIHQEDLPTLRSVKIYAPNYGFVNFQESEPDDYFQEGDKIVFGNSSLEVIFLPGHSPGHVAFLNHEEKICIGGDVLFNGSIGRTDLPGGDYETLLSSIQEKLFKYDKNITVYTGHGEPTTIEKEMRTNPFCAIHS